MRHLLALALLFVAATLIAGPAHAQTSLLWSFSGNGSLQAIVASPDIDGDGRPDIVFEGYENGPSGVNHVFAISGASAGTGTAIWSAQPIGGVSSGGGWGDNCLRLGPDLNGDGHPDLLLGTAWGGRTAYALNGASGGTLWGFDTYAHYGSSASGWIYAMDSLGSDLTGDGVPEVVFCSGSYNDRIHCVNGATGAQRWVYYAGDAFFDIRSCQDITGDGVRDVVACLGDNSLPGQVIALNGATGALRWSRPINYALWNLTFITDITGDGIPEVVPSSWGPALYCINGATGAVVWSVPTGAQQRVATLDDVNGDGVEDIAVGYNATSAARCFSGLNGAVLWTRALAGNTWAIDRVADVTGDGINDVCVGDFGGNVTVLDGVTGQVFWAWLNPTHDKIMTIRGVPDLNGNGAPDVVAGTQLLYGGSGGDVYALEGNANPTSVPGASVIAGLHLSEAYPNPMREGTAWNLLSSQAGTVRVLLFGADGRRVRDLGGPSLPAGGSTSLLWDGRDGDGLPVPAGVYHAKILLNGRAIADRKAVVIR